MKTRERVEYAICATADIILYILGVNAKKNGKSKMLTGCIAGLCAVEGFAIARLIDSIADAVEKRKS